MWLYGGGFPKSMNIGKAIEGKLTIGSANVKDIKKLDGFKTRVTDGFNKTGKETGYRDKEYEKVKTDVNYHTELGKYYNSWGTALKPSFEPIIVARKPLDGTCVDNVIKWGVGGINIDECRVGNEKLVNKGMSSLGVMHDDNWVSNKEVVNEVNGRFPANTILTYDDTDFEEVCGGFPNTKGNGNVRHNKNDGKGYNCYSNYGDCDTRGYEDSGSASRYFYCAKASKRDRDEGLEEFEEKKVNDGRKKDADNAFQRGKTLRHNTHPTVKPTSLMQYLVRLVTPKGGTVLDPFMGSGSTGKAVAYENKDRQANYNFIGIEKEKEYIDIAQARIDYASREEQKEEPEEEQLNLF